MKYQLIDPKPGQRPRDDDEVCWIQEDRTKEENWGRIGDLRKFGPWDAFIEPHAFIYRRPIR